MVTPTEQESSGRVRLEAGPLNCDIVGADVWNLCVGRRRLLTRLYIAVRDAAWNTIPFRCRTSVVEQAGDARVMSMSCSVDSPPISAKWAVRIVLSSAGTFRYEMSGEALSDFEFAKIGLNLHHPLPETLGSRFEARRGDRSVTGRIPALIDPQLFVEGKLTGMFMPYDRLTLHSARDDRVEFSFEGDEFEMQDHRNWTDYNLKTYGTPLEVPLPLYAREGDRIEQAVSIDVHGAKAFWTSARGRAAEPRVAIVRHELVKRPSLGTEFPDDLGKPREATASLSKAIGLDYLRVNLDLSTAEGMARAHMHAEVAEEWGIPLELVVVVTPGGARLEELASLREWLGSSTARIVRTVVLEGPRGFIIGRTTTPPATVRDVRTVFEQFGAVPCISATEQFFAELNRWWPDASEIDGFGFSICPQVHAADETSLMENSFGQSDTVLTARLKSGGRPVHVVSVEMIGKYGPYPGGVPKVDDLSKYGDPRQHQMFGAAWTLNSLVQLTVSHAASATYFELFGDRGVVQETRERGEAWADPVCRVLQAVLSWPMEGFVRLDSVDGCPVVGMGAESSDRGEYLLANLSGDSVRVELDGLMAPVVSVAVLEEGSHSSASWREVPSGREPVPTLECPPYGVVRVGSH